MTMVKVVPMIVMATVTVKIEANEDEYEEIIQKKRGDQMKRNGSVTCRHYVAHD